MTPSLFLGRLIGAVRVNAIAREQQAGKWVWVKRRKFLMDAVIACGNIFLYFSSSRIQMFPNCLEWQEGELHCYRLLYKERLQGGLAGKRGIWIEELPGQSLLQILCDRNLSLLILRAAANEFLRAHSLFCPKLQDYWSHGDPHLANVLYDSHTKTAMLIDFETKHQQSLTAQERHADDLLVFILDLLGRVPFADWLYLAVEFRVLRHNGV
ncbi:hypothetical protein LAY57_35690 [Argonema antarcticum A004/B2]|uniref:hypothetical protein n=1 Tax=Argonema antarcticum TaxID=2942763 RepID=UPI0030DDBDC1|nr:hypothetical protein [Argonema antarcticum A004/B2]